MQRKLIWLVLIIIIALKFSSVNSWQAIEKHVENPRLPGKCYNSQFHIYIKVGDSVGGYEHNDERFCEKMTCVETLNGELEIHHDGCAFINPEENCRIVKGRKSLPYPLCCSHLKCKEESRQTAIAADPDISWANEFCQSYCRLN